MPVEPPPHHPRFNLHPDGSNYDFHSQRRVPHPTNVLESAVHLVKGCLGGGIMGIHCAYQEAGLWTAVVFSVLFGIYITYCIWMIVHSAQMLYRRLHITEMSYPDVAEMALHTGPFPKLRKYSKAFRYAVDIIICFDLFGSCCVYQIMIAKTLSQLYHTWIKQEPGNYVPSENEIRIYVCIIFLPIVLLCMIRSLKYLAPFSLVANCFIVICVGATVFYSVEKIKDQDIGLDSIPSFQTWSGFFQFCGVVVFSMEGVGVALPIENNMKHPNLFPVALISGMTTVVGFVMTVGFFGFWGFSKDGLQAPVILNFPSTPFPTIIKALMGFMIYVTFALNFWAPFNLLWYYIAKKYDPSTHWKWERVYRAIVITAITILSIAFPKITNFMGLLGAFCLSNMGFIFPAFIEICVKWYKPGLGPCRWILWKNIVIIILGVVLFVSSTYFNAVEMITTKVGGC